jgi:hypothetical protein
MTPGCNISRRTTYLPTAFGCLSKTSPKVGSFCGHPFHCSLYSRLILAINTVALREVKVVENKHAVGIKNCVWLQALIRWDLWASKRQSNDAHCTHRLRKSRHDPEGNLNDRNLEKHLGNWDNSVDHVTCGTKGSNATCAHLPCVISAIHHEFS